MSKDSDTPSVGVVIAWILAVIVALTVLDWVGESVGLLKYGFFAPKYEKVRRETYEQTKSYRDGQFQRLDNLCDEVARTDDDHKSMIYDTIKHEFTLFKLDDINNDHSRACLAKARAN